MYINISLILSFKFIELSAKEAEARLLYHGEITKLFKNDNLKLHYTFISVMK